MKAYYSVAHNLFAVEIPSYLAAWHTLQPRFAPFEVGVPEGELAFEATVNVGSLPVWESGEVYEPDHAGIGFITSRAGLLPGGEIVVEFKHISESASRLTMKLSADMHTATIYICPKGDETDPYFLTHALMIAYMASTCANGTLMIHSSAVLYDGKVYLFQGKSGTGKSTHSRMWLETIPGTELLNDDNPLLRISPQGIPMAFGSPWSGKTHCYRAMGAPVGAFVRIVRAPENRVEFLPPLKAYASLTSSVLNMPFLPSEFRTMRHKTIEQLVGAVPCCAMHCTPTPEAARVCMAALTSNS